MKTRIANTRTLAKAGLSSAASSVKKVAPKLGLYAVAFALAATFSIVSAHAQAAGGGYALGSDGGPTGSDYLASGNGFAANLGPILKSTLPLMLGMLAVWQGPRIIKSLVKRFSS